MVEYSFFIWVNPDIVITKENPPRILELIGSIMGLSGILVIAWQTIIAINVKLIEFRKKFQSAEVRSTPPNDSQPSINLSDDYFPLTNVIEKSK